MTLCEQTNGACPLESLKMRIENLISIADCTGEEAIAAPNQDGFRELAKMSDAYRLQALRLQAGLNRQACRVCWNKTYIST